MSDHSIRLGQLRAIPDSPAERLSADEAIGASRAEWIKARAAQVELVANLQLTRALFDGKTVTYHRLRFMRDEAHGQVKRALAVANALDEAIGAMERTRA